MKKFSSKELIFIRNLLLTAVLGALIGFLNYLFNIFIARYTTENIFNIFSAALGLIYLLQIPTLAIQAVITKKVGEKKDFNLNSFKWRSLLIFTFIGIIFSILFYLVRGFVADTANIPISTMFSLSLVLIFGFVSPISKGILFGQEKIVFVNIVLLLETVSKFIMGWIAIKSGGNIDLLILANAIPTFVSTIIILPFIKSEGVKKEKKPINVNYKELILMVISFFLLSTPYTLDLILVNPSFRADYSALTLIGKIVYFGSITISTVMFARLVNQKKKKNEIRTLIFSLGLTLLIGLGISFGIYLFRDILADLVFDGKYNGISSYMAVYGVCMTAYAFVYMVINYLIAEGSYWFISLLISTTALQIFLFEKYNSDLNMVVNNQLILYGILFLLVCLNLFFHIKFIKNGND